MMKRNFAAFGLASVLSLSALTGCSSGNGTPSAAETQTSAETSAQDTESSAGTSSETSQDQTETSQEEDSASQSGESEASQSSETLDSILNSIKEAYGDTYAPNMQMDSQMLEDLTGITPDQYTAFVAEMPMISTFVETFIGVEATEESADAVEEALNSYRDSLLEDTMQYPMSIPKIQASQVVRHDSYVFFVMLGAADDAALEQGEEKALESARENNQKAIDIINEAFE